MTASSPTSRRTPLRALRWIDEWGDRDGDGFVEYERRTLRGLANQSWKDRRLAALRRRAPRAGADRAVRGAGLRLRREAPHGRAGARSGATASSPSGSTRRRRSCAAASTRRTGWRGAATTRSRSTATSSRSTRSARTSAICSGAGSSRSSAPRPSPTSCSASRSGLAGVFARCRPRTPRTTRSRTTTGACGRTTTP